MARMLAGTVRDAANRPVAGTPVYLAHNGRWAPIATTDGDGRFAYWSGMAHPGEVVTLAAGAGVGARAVARLAAGGDGAVTLQMGPGRGSVDTPKQRQANLETRILAADAKIPSEGCGCGGRLAVPVPPSAAAASSISFLTFLRRIAIRLPQLKPSVNALGLFADGAAMPLVESIRRRPDSFAASLFWRQVGSFHVPVMYTDETSTGCPPWPSPPDLPCSAATNDVGIAKQEFAQATFDVVMCTSASQILAEFSSAPLIFVLELLLLAAIVAAYTNSEFEKLCLGWGAINGVLVIGGAVQANPISGDGQFGAPGQGCGPVGTSCGTNSGQICALCPGAQITTCEDLFRPCANPGCPHDPNLNSCSGACGPNCEYEMIGGCGPGCTCSATGGCP